MNPSIFENEHEFNLHLKALVADAEELLNLTDKETTEEMVNLRNRLKNKIVDIKYTLELRAKKTDQYVRENPWKAIGVSATIGLILGLLISERK